MYCCDGGLSDVLFTTVLLTLNMGQQTMVKKILNQSFNTFSDWLPYLDVLDSYPATRCTVVMAVYQMFYSQPQQ